MMNEFKTIADMVCETASADPQRLCIVDETREWTYGDVWTKVLCAASALKSRGVKPGERILVRCMQDGPFLIMDFACNLTGAVFVPLEKEAAESRAADISEETEPVLYVGGPVASVPCPQVSFQELTDVGAGIIAKGEGPEDAWVRPDPETTAEILYTTGTTGKSKGIEVTYANNIALAQNVSEGTKMRDRNVEFVPLPISHSHGLRTCYGNFYKGGTVILADGMRNVKGIWDQLTRYQARALDLSPTAANVMLRLFKKVLGQLNEQLEYIEIGTAALSEPLKEALKAALPKVRLYNFYGSTESGRSCVLNFNSGSDRKFCVGFPSVNAHFIITDDDRNEIASSPERTGLLACAGSMNMKGYWKQPELTAGILKNGYIFTNDEAYIDEDGCVYVLGRKDDVINFMGIKIAPEEIEEAARGYEGVADCACVPRPDASAGQIPCLFVAAKDPEAFDRKALAAYLSGIIDSNKQPKQIVLIDEIPRTQSGKIQRKKLAAL